MYIQRLQLTRVGEGLHESAFYKEHENTIATEFSLSLEEIRVLALATGQGCLSKKTCNMSNTPAFCGLFKSTLHEHSTARKLQEQSTTR